MTDDDSDDDGRQRLTIVRRHGTVGELHAVDPFVGQSDIEPQLWWYEPLSTSLVLGSRQAPELFDVDLCARLDIDVVRRRSGGGAVLVDPDRVVWVDIVVPHGVAPDDVRGSMVWAGERWRDALAAFVPASSELAVNQGSSMATAWSDLVCFAGVGPGEVLLDGRKLVGLSQRRTRRGIRIQGMLYTHPPAIDITRLFVVPTPDAPLPGIASLGVDLGRLIHRLADLRG